MGSFWSKETKHGGSGRSHSVTLSVQKKQKRKREGKNYTLKDSIINDLKIVGFKTKLIDNLDITYLENLNHIEAIKNLCHSLMTKDDIYITDELYDIYCEIGLNRTSAKLYTKIFEEIWKFGNHTFDQILDLTIEYALGKYEPLRPKNISFLLQEKIESWFIPEDRRKLEITNTAVFHMNINKSEDAANKGDISSIPGLSPDVLLLYHATNWGSAVNIINRGPKHTRGGLCLDFGSLPGFYVTPSIQTAVEWTVKHRACWKDECAIIVFAANKNIISPLSETENVIFDKPDKKWKKLTRESRMCQENELDETDFVFGPMVANANAVSKRGATPITHSPPLIQLTGKSDIADKIMLKAMVGVFWIKK